MTFSRYIRIWRELNAYSIKDISDELKIPQNKIRNFDITPTNKIIMEWYLSHGLILEDFNHVKERYERKKNKPQGNSN